MTAKALYSAVAVVAAAAGFAIYRYGIEPALVAQSSENTAQDAAQAAAPPREIPSELPAFSLQDRAGVARSIRSWPGKSMVVNFWATWCAPCRREIPLLMRLQKEHGPEGFQVVGVAVDFRDAVLKYAEEMQINYPLLIGEEDGLEAALSFGLGSPGFPFTVFTDQQHRIVVTHLGELHEAQADIIFDAIGQVNLGNLTPAAARIVVAKQLYSLPRQDLETALPTAGQTG